MKLKLATLHNNLYCYRAPINHQVQHKASVLILILKKEELSLLLTRRSKKLRSHSGQVAFPGGKQDPKDANPLETALRETQEEVGLVKTQVQILGQIDQILSIHNYLVTPYVGQIPADFHPTPNYAEIESVFSVPISFFMQAENHTAKERSQHFRPYLCHHFFYQDYDIWGLTALLILRLLEIGFHYIPPYSVYHPASPTWMELTQQFTEESSLISI